MQGGVDKPKEITFLGPRLGTGKVLPPIVGPVLPHSSDNRLQTTITEQINHFWLKTELYSKFPQKHFPNLFWNDLLPFEEGTLLLLFLDAAEELSPEICTSSLDCVQNRKKATVTHIVIFLWL